MPFDTDSISTPSSVSFGAATEALPFGRAGEPRAAETGVLEDMAAGRLEGRDVYDEEKQADEGSILVAASR